MPYVLKHEEIIVGDETLKVYQASNIMGAKRALLIDRARESTPALEGEDTEESYGYYLKVLLYPSLVACTEGNLPTLEEFLTQLPEEESDRWSEAAKRLNPHWFTFFTKEVPEEKKEK